MARRTKKNSSQERWMELGDTLERLLPHLSSVLGDSDDFIALYLKARDDGTILAIAKKYASDGSPVVCFGSGYGVAGALMAIDATIQGGHWKVDKPWGGGSK